MGRFLFFKQYRRQGSSRQRLLCTSQWHSNLTDKSFQRYIRNRMGDVGEPSHNLHSRSRVFRHRPGVLEHKHIKSIWSSAERGKWSALQVHCYEYLDRLLHPLHLSASDEFNRFNSNRHDTSFGSNQSYCESYFNFSNHSLLDFLNGQRRGGWLSHLSQWHSNRDICNGLVC